MNDIRPAQRLSAGVGTLLPTNPIPDSHAANELMPQAPERRDERKPVLPGAPAIGG
jgi:hypothetical protein